MTHYIAIGGFLCLKCGAIAEGTEQERLDNVCQPCKDKKETTEVVDDADVAHAGGGR